MNLTWLDSNSWLLETSTTNNTKILIDPWLIGDLTFNNIDWLFKGSRVKDRVIPDNIDLIILSQGLEDHAHPPTLKQLDKNIPVIASPNATKVVQQLGYREIITLEHGQQFTLKNQLLITAFPGSPIGPTLTENAYLIKDIISNYSIYYEPHGYHSAAIKEIPSIDVVITPTIDLGLPLLGNIIQGMNNTLELAKNVKPQFILPTAAGGDITFTGIIAKFLQAKGTATELQTLLSQNNLNTKVLTPIPGEKITLN
ncbi:MBL fold metallo-hydrolase [Anabaena sp. FACHB-1237]|uniref:MBL fold metallo-hydrolase n=1 Tax=Anabaena sp. FACHB-1237 TaxID=2692769 RepID=UPI00167FFBFA|nr:MBL fold metallo-hydrolase [Anabaena sp. FACHB-1237]MBD2138163.1 MBL fold metallo-hydrolase [Anabaena sp. FACHB-1237]